MTQIQSLLLTELRGYMLGKLDVEIAELKELHSHLARLVEENPPQPANAVMVEE